jgi:hypothetical protein
LGLDQFTNRCRGGRESQPPLLQVGRDHACGEQLSLPVPLPPMKMIGSALTMSQ